MKPVPSQPKVTFPYGARYKSGDLHKGDDFAARTGTKVVAAVSGVVVHAGPHKRLSGYGPAYGTQVIIQCDNFQNGSKGYFALYAHLSAVSVAKGQHVKAGQAIGKVGATGNVTGPHLHFEIQKRRFWGGWLGSINPRKWENA